MATRRPEQIEISRDGWKTNSWVDWEVGFAEICKYFRWKPEYAEIMIFQIVHAGDDGEWSRSGTYGDRHFEFRFMRWVQKSK